MVRGVENGFFLLFALEYVTLKPNKIWCMMSLSIAESLDDLSNPLDCIEDIFVAREWVFERVSEDELHVDIGGRWCDYRLHFLWRDELSVLHFTILLDLKVKDKKKPVLYELLSKVNEKLWLGHFAFIHTQSIPCFRHALPFRGTIRVSTEQIEDLIEIALDECERFYPAFQMVVLENKTIQEAFEIALFETIGEA